MSNPTQDIRTIAKRLLAAGDVDVVIGCRPSSQPLHDTPHFARTPQEADQLAWTLGSSLNLAKYLLDRDARSALVVKPCDARGVLAYAKENQIDLARVTLIGVPCLGVVSRHKLRQLLGDRDVREAEEDGEHIVLRGRDFEERVPKADLLRDTCLTCSMELPAECEIVAGEPSHKTDEADDEFPDVREFEAKPASERWGWFCQEFGRCIRCYACRNACPACYCEQCFVDSTDPEWVGKGNDLADTQFFHLLRAVHTAGRCVDCGACERACPMGIELRRLTRKVRKDVKELFGAEAGADADSAPALGTYDPDDPEDGITE